VAEHNGGSITVKTIFISIAFATGAAALAQAQTTTTTQKCEDTLTGGRACTTELSKEPIAPGVVAAPKTQQQQSAEDARTAKWEAYCKPTIKQGSDGIDRYQYADPGCASGKSEK
jgi:hypothetical protein